MGPQVPDLSEQVNGGDVIWGQRRRKGWGWVCPLTMLPPRLGLLLDSQERNQSSS